MIETRIGDMLINVLPDPNVAKIMTHGTNCHGRMGSGIAPLIKKLYPEVYEVYRRQFHTEHGLKLGEITLASPYVWLPFIVVNSNIQNKYRGFRNPDGTIEPYDAVYCNYDAMRSCFQLINKRAIAVLGVSKMPVEVHFPLIGCGLAGGDWEIVSKIIDEELDDRITKVLWKLK